MTAALKPLNERVVVITAREELNMERPNQRQRRIRTRG